MKTIARKAEERQILLSEHQDAVVAAKFLASVSAAGDGQSNNGFTYGILMANELHLAAETRASLKK